MFKPFKHLQPRAAAKSAEIISIPGSDSEDNHYKQPPAKKRRLIHIVDNAPPVPKATASTATFAPRKPLLVVNNVAEGKMRKEASGDGVEGYYMVQWRKFTNKKHKTWEGDGVLAVFDGYARLQDLSSREMGKVMFKDPLLPESTLSVGGKEIQVESVLTKAQFLSGEPFINNAPKRPLAEISNDKPPPVAKAPISLPKGRMPLLGPKKGKKAENNAEEGTNLEISAKSFYANTHKSTAMNAQFKNPLLKTTVMSQKKDGGAQPRHSPTAPGALIMKRPKDCPKGKEIVDVVLDPFLSQHLREHQREGVKFLYECVMGLRDFNGQGAVLADEMGLGKTLQTIALLWTLLKQNPIYSPNHSGVIKKALIVCPATLIINWKKEFQKWLGNERIGVLVADDKKTKITDFTHGKSYSVMIIGYEKLRNVQEELKKGAGVDIVIADEGHRLKTAQNKSAQAIRSLNTPKRVILSGTPIQNDLSEFFVMVDFVNPGLMGTYKTFKKVFEVPIVKSRQPGASKKDLEIGTAREEEMLTSTKQFILRRTSEILSKYLPPKTEYVIFCKPTQAQVQVYQHVIASPFFGRVIGSSEAAFQLIMLLKKVCNSPSLLFKKEDAIPISPNVAEMIESIPAELLRQAPVKSSGKLRVLDQMLKHLSSDTKEKIVLVSNYTTTLDILGQHLASLGLPFLRLDGNTPTARRQDLVDTFNKDPASKTFAFLLSAKSGGAGLNLIGASRLVLFDVDWNPAIDLQAMARIHRDGQRRPVKIYRLLMAGCIDEKIYQRQVNKMGLADSVVDGKKSDSSFTPEELRDLFRLNLDSDCQTHDLLGCDCRGLGIAMLPSSPPSDLTSSSSLAMVDNSDDEDFPLHFRMVKDLVAGTKANIKGLEETERREAQKKKSEKADKMQALMLYRHVDMSILKEGPDDVYDAQLVIDVEDVLGDEVLVEVLKEKACKVGYVFAKKDRVE